ncbi:MAG: beta-glucuronidase [Labilibaculum sp.]|nr:beta-glucuronidase [Labilibaculum sp.]
MICIGCFGCKSTDTIDLSRVWNYKLDTKNIGLSEKWYTQSFKDTLRLPGSLRDNGIGSIPSLKTPWTGSIYDSSWYFNPAMEKYRKTQPPKFPFWLTPEHCYKGVAWFQKEIEIPKNWEGQSLKLFLERPHWQTRAWIDTIFLGQCNSLSTPHEFLAKAGKIKAGKHLLTIQVDNAIRDIDPGINSHSISDHTQGNWNGIVGEMKLYPICPTHIKQVKLIPDLKHKKVIAEITISNFNQLKNTNIQIQVLGYNHEHKLKPLTTNVKDTIFVEYPMGDDFKSWSEFTPNLYQMSIQLRDSKNQVIDSRMETFGMRNFSIQDKHFYINGAQIFLRGTTECCVFPLTGYPPTNESDWSRIYNICKSFGLNHMRFHSYCPPEAAFKAADKAGFYLQLEGPSWAKYSVTLGDGKPIDKYLMKETKRIIDTYGNHPSFVMMAYGNEPSGHYVGYLNNWVDHFKAYDSQRVFTGASTGRSWAIIENSDFIVRSPPRGLSWNSKQPESMFDYRNKTENQQRPYVTFEMGQWCAFPNFKEIEKYKGPLKARNFELFQEELNNNNMGHQAENFLMASGKVQASCYKQEIEATLRTPNLAGFQLLSLNDFTGQGTALVGVLDPFWDEKGYIKAEEFKDFCNQVVPLVRLPKFTFTNNESLKTSIEVANFSGNDLKQAKVLWQLLDNTDSVIKTGNLKKTDIPQGNTHLLDSIDLPLNFIHEAGKYTLKVSINEYKNHWPIWVYPNQLASIDTNNIYICNTFNKKAKASLKEGKNVLLLASGNIENGKDVKQSFTPVFWNTSWFRMRPPHTTGMWIEKDHPVFKHFPTDYYSDMHWWELMQNNQVINMEQFPVQLQSMIQPIDTWFLNRKLSMLFETRVGKGKLLVTSCDLESNMDNKPVAKQLYYSIIQYMNSAEFNPSVLVESETVAELFEKKDRPIWNSYVNSNP